MPPQPSLRVWIAGSRCLLTRHLSDRLIVCLCVDNMLYRGRHGFPRGKCKLAKVNDTKTKKLITECKKGPHCVPDEEDPCQGHCECSQQDKECQCKVGPPTTTPGPHDDRVHKSQLAGHPLFSEAMKLKGFQNASKPRNENATYDFLSNRKTVEVEVGSQTGVFNQFTVLSRELVCPPNMTREEELQGFCEDPDDPWLWDVRCPLLFNATSKFLPGK